MEALEEGSGKEKQSHFILLIQPKHKSFICIFQLFYFIFFLSDTFSFLAPVFWPEISAERIISILCSKHPQPFQGQFSTHF